MTCLNPYYAGIWSRSVLVYQARLGVPVLILIMLEYGLGDLWYGLWVVFLTVLILIMLEYGLGA